MQGVERRVFGRYPEGKLTGKDQFSVGIEEGTPILI
jgi:hypothetical protein